MPSFDFNPCKDKQAYVKQPAIFASHRDSYKRKQTLRTAALRQIKQ